MSRSDYDDDIEAWAMIRWRGQVASAIRGKRGQNLLRDLLASLDAMPEKRLIAESLTDKDGYCALGVLGASRGMQLDALDADDPEQVAAAFGIATPLAREIVYINDEAGWWNDTPEKRWTRVREWVAQNIAGGAA